MPNSDDRKVDPPDDRGRRLERRLLKLAMPAFERHIATHGGSLTTAGVARVRDEARRAFARRANRDLTSLRDARGRLCPTAVDEYVQAYVLIAVDPERRAFAAIAFTVLVQIQMGADRRLPHDIVERSYDLAVTATERRARRGVERFRERPGVPDPAKVSGYVHVVFEFKLKQAWTERTARPSELPYDAEFDAWWDASQSGEDIGDEADWDALLQAARAWLEEFKRDGIRLERLRMRDIELALIAADVGPQSIEVVLARAARRWVTDVTEDGLRRRALRAAGWREIAERLGISTPNNAAKIFSRVLEGLSPVVRRWINAPESYAACDGDAPASPAAG